MRVLSVAAQGIERAAASASATANRLVSAGGEGDLATDMVNLSIEARLLAANVTVARTAAETESEVVRKLSVRG